MGDDERFRELLAAQQGVFTSHQARRLGCSGAAITGRCRSGAWERLGATVLHARDHELTATARMRAATWIVGPRAALAGGSAAFWLGLLETAPPTITVNAPRGRHGSGITVPEIGPLTVWHRNLHDDDIVLKDRVRTVAPALTALDTAVTEGLTFLGRCVLWRRVTVDELQAAHRRYPGRRGATRAGELLALLDGGARSEAEARFHRLLRDDGLSGWRANVRVAGWLVDCAFDAERVVIEIDGLTYHSDPATAERDRHRRNALENAGWTVRSFTWTDLVTRPQYVIAVIRAALDLRRTQR